MRRPRGLLALLALGAACQLPPRDGDVVDPSVNVCVGEEDLDGPCGPESVCRGGICRARAADERRVVFTVIRSAVSGTGNGQAELFLPSLPSGEPITLESLRQLREPDPLDPGKVTALDLTLPPLSSLKVSLLGPDPTDAPTSARGCVFEQQSVFDRSLPVNVSLRPASTQRGLPLATFARNAADPTPSAPLAYTVQTTLQAPPALYDLYLQPSVSPACPIPPILWPGYPLGPGVNPPQNLDLSTLDVRTLAARVTVDPSIDLSQWRARLIDSITGLTVSTTVGLVREPTPGQWSLPEPSPDGPPPLEYYEPLGVSDPRLFLILTPPAGGGAPQLALDLNAFNPFGKPSIAVDLGALSLASVEVELRTERDADAAVQPAQVLLTSPLEVGALVGAPAALLAFFAIGPRATDEAGLTRLTLPPGRYDARALAPDDALGIGSRSLTFLPTPDGTPLAGFSIPLAERAVLDVPVLPPASDAPLSAVSFSVTPSLAPASLATRLFAAPEMSPRASSGRTEADGHLRTRTDRGTFDITLRLPADRGFPWLVRPDADLPLGDDVAGSLRVSLPVEVVGTARTSQSRALSGAMLRAYAQLASGRYVLVAEDVIDSAGGYRLLLPSRL